MLPYKTKNLLKNINSQITERSGNDLVNLNQTDVFLLRGHVSGRSRNPRQSHNEILLNTQ